MSSSGVKHATRQFVRSVRIVAENAYYFHHACLYVRMYQRGFRWRDFREIYTLWKSLGGKSKFVENLEKKYITLHEDISMLFCCR